MSARGTVGGLEAAAAGAGEQQIQNTRSYDRNKHHNTSREIDFRTFWERSKKIRTGDEVTTRRRTLHFPLPGDAIQLV